MNQTDYIIKIGKFIAVITTVLTVVGDPTWPLPEVYWFTN